MQRVSSATGIPVLSYDGFELLDLGSKKYRLIGGNVDEVEP
jgi:hypothetical protein